MIKWVLFLFTTFSFCFAAPNAQITVNMKDIKPGVVEKHHFGMFMEYINYRVTGKYGVSAEELLDRGFDCDRNGMDWEKTQFWEFYNTCSPDSALDQKPWYSGYNKHGLRSYLVRRNAEIGEAGYRQSVILDSGKTFDFYIHVKGEIDSVYLRLIAIPEGKVIFESSLGTVPPDWQKRTAVINPLEKQTNVDVIIYGKKKGILQLDEASLMSRDNKYYLRKEFFELMKAMKPGMLRFPGGCFADAHTWRFEEHLGNKDQRVAPNYWYDATVLRMDFALDEYLNFCKELEIEPYLVFNYNAGSIQEALNLLEYCNGGVNTKYGKMRADNGHPEPYNVRYFEVGNEQWENVNADYPEKYVAWYKALKNYDPNIKIMVCGYHWSGINDVQRVYSKVNKNSEYYSWHPAAISTPKLNLSEEEEYWGFASWSLITQYDIDWISKALEQHTGNTALNAPTEFWTAFEEGTLDTSKKSSSLLAALTEMNFLHTIVRNAPITGPSCRTLFLGIYKEEPTSSGGRAYFGSPGFNAYMMFFNHSGKDLVSSSYSGETFTFNFNYINFLNKVPYLDFVATKSKDTLYLSVINRHISEPVKTVLNIKDWKHSSKANIYQLTSNHFYDYNDGDNPKKVFPNTFSEVIGPSYSFPPHSFTILAIPLSDFTSINESEITEKIDYNILPNPAKDFLYFDSYNKTLNQIEIYDINGKLLTNLVLNKNGLNEINIMELIAGTYIIKANVEGNIISAKFIKQ